MTFPLQDVLTAAPELGLALAVLLGFGFGFALERAGFGRANKLAAQFYLTDMTVFKVMFGAIVTAMLGLVIADGLGVIQLHALSTAAASQTYIWPMALGGFMLGVGFIVAGYCPGTSIVSAATGNIDGLTTIVGVVLGTLVYGWAYPLLGSFPESSAQGHLFLYEWLGVPPWVVAVAVAGMAMAMFVGAEKVETIFSRKAHEKHQDHMLAPDTAKSHTAAFEVFGAAAALAAVVALFWPVTSDAAEKRVETMPAAALAERVIEQPWQVRVLDLRAREACAEQRVPGAECVPQAELKDLGLAYSPATRPLVLVGGEDMQPVPEAALAFPGRLFVLEGGFAAWKAYALDAPEPPGDDASAEQRAEYRLRAGLNKALTGKAPPPPPPVKGFVAPKAKKGGGCN